GTALWADNFAGQSQLTVEAWIKRSTTGSFQTIAGNYQSTYPMLLRLDNGKLSLYLNSGPFATSTNTIPVGKWTHVAGTYDGTNMKVYIDGVLEGSNTLSAALISATDEIKIGGGLTNNSEYFSGSIADV